MDTAVYSLVPPQGKASAALWIPVVLVVLVSVVGSFVVVKSLTGAKGSTFTLSPAGLAIRGDLYGRTIPAASLRGAAARVLDLGSEPGLAPVRRTMGTAVPGYRSGWFRLANGEKALLYVTSRERVVHVPTAEGFCLLLSVSEPERFVEHLKRVAPAG